MSLYDISSISNDFTNINVDISVIKKMEPEELFGSMG